MKIIEFNDENIVEITELFIDNWGSEKITVHAKMHNIKDLDGFIARKNKEIYGIITYEINENKCEIISLDSFHEDEGIGEKLLEKVFNIAYDKKCKSVWHITTNDNINAIRFYQMRGFDLVELSKNAVRESRKLNPSIPEYGYFGIPVKHELKFELVFNKN